jgi:hypothetical protein
MDFMSLLMNFHCIPIVTALLERPRQVKRTGTAGPGETPLGTRTFTWFRPVNPGALPKYDISARRPPIATCGGVPDLVAKVTAAPRAFNLASDCPLLAAAA